jgi:hypothetical protein
MNNNLKKDQVCGTASVKMYQRSKCTFSQKLCIKDPTECSQETLEAEAESVQHLLYGSGMLCVITYIGIEVSSQNCHLISERLMLLGKG